MAQREGEGGHGPLAALGGAGIGLAALLRVCSHEAAVVDDVARLATAGASHADEVARLGGMGDELAGVGGVGDDLARAGDDAGEVLADVVGHGLDAVDVGGAVIELVGGPGEDGASVWIGEPASLAALNAGLGRHPGEVVGFIARLDGTRLRVGATTLAWEDLEAACGAARTTCWVYVGREGVPESVARMSWNRTEGEVPEVLDGFTGRVIAAP